MVCWATRRGRDPGPAKRSPCESRPEAWERRLQKPASPNPAGCGRRGSLPRGSGRSCGTGALVIVGKKVLCLPRRPAPGGRDRAPWSEGRELGQVSSALSPWPKLVAAAHLLVLGRCRSSEPGVGSPGTLGRLQCGPVQSSSPAGVGGVNLTLRSKPLRGRVGVGVGGRISRQPERGAWVSPSAWWALLCPGGWFSSVHQGVFNME